MQFVKFVTDFRPMNDDNPYSPPTTAWSTTRDDQSEIEPAWEIGQEKPVIAQSGC
jgi:hypothetical protein